MWDIIWNNDKPNTECKNNQRNTVWIFLLLKNIEIFIFIKAHFGVANQRIPFFEMWSSACFKGSSKMTPFEVQKWNGHDNGKVGISCVSGLSLTDTCREADIARLASHL